MQGQWMKLPVRKGARESAPWLALFRGLVALTEVPERLRIQITADSRYKLYINGAFVEAGPSRGDGKVWYVDTVDIAPWLLLGENVLAVEVLRYPAVHSAGCYGIIRTKTPGLYVGSELSVDWMCRRYDGYAIVPENPHFSPLMIYERVEGDATLAHWQEPGFRGNGWTAPALWDEAKLTQELRPDRLRPRTTPFLYRELHRFSGVSKGGSEWDALIRGNVPLAVPAHAVLTADLDAGELTTGYLHLSMAGGTGARITLLQAECYAGERIPHADPYKCLPEKGDRTDPSRFLYGYTDQYRVAGFGTSERPENYEPYWFRAFRFIRITVETENEPLTLLKMDYEETGYPLEVRSKVETSDSSLASVWEICERSLRRCMHETYEDCPFYERLQYAMDARSEMLYTYAVSGDDRLALRCMDDLAASLRPDGMINCCAPNYETNVIPGFGIYFTGMVYDHMWYFGDRQKLERHWPVVESILSFFRERLDSRGLVGKLGDVNRPGQFWSFIDWTAGWDDTDGVPPATKLGPLTMESLLYAMGLRYASEIGAFLGFSERAEEYRIQADCLCAAVNRFCVGPDGMYQDGPGVEQYSQHSQVFAVLAGATGVEQGRRILKRTLDEPNRFQPCSVAMCWYLFRAMEQSGLYRYTDQQWNVWRRMKDDHLTTCPEDPLLSRSDCHGWGALALYEFPAVVLGVRPSKPGFSEITVEPKADWLDWAEGRVPTPKGYVSVSWSKDAQGKILINARGPEGIPMHIIPNA